VKNNQHNQIRTFLYLIQVQAVHYAVISATYYRFCDSTPFKIACGSIGSATQLVLPYAKIQEESIWQSTKRRKG